MSILDLDWEIGEIECDEEKLRKIGLDFDIGFHEWLLTIEPENIYAMMILGEAYTQAGFYNKGLKMDLKLSNLLPHEPTVHYNLACSYSLLGKKRAAISELKKAISLGYDDFEHLKEDPDLSNIREDNEFRELIS